MKKNEDKVARAAHLKKHTVGTSNEISFSVLDAMRNAATDEKAEKKRKFPGFGSIHLFTLPRKKTIATPTKKDALPLSGDVLPETSSQTPGVLSPVAGSSSATSGGAASPAASKADSQGMPEAISDSASAATVDLGTPAVSATTSDTLVPPSEVSKRKSTRIRRKTITIAVIVVLAASLLGVAGYFGYEYYTNFQAHLATLDDAMDALTEADKKIVAMDESMGNLVAESPEPLLSEDQQKTFEDTLASLDETRTQLKTASMAATTARSGMQKGAEDWEAANQALSAISGREVMLENAEIIIAEAQGATAASEDATAAWDKVLEADSAAREAALLVTETTNDNIKASSKKLKEAQKLFEEAESAYAAVASEYASLDVSPYQDYIAKRIEALKHAVASNDALLDRNKEDAQKENDAYNKAETAAAKMAEKFASNPTQFITDTFVETTQEARDAYNNARSDVGSADAFLRDYLGISS